jgi:hypothetical protein
VLGVFYTELNYKMRTWKVGPSCVLLDLTLKGLTTENGHFMAYTSHSTIDGVIYVVKGTSGFFDTNRADPYSDSI